MHNIIITLTITFNIPHAISDINISATATLQLNNNPAYGTQIPLQQNVEYENTTFTTSTPQDSWVLIDSVELAYEVVSLISNQSASATTEMDGRSREERQFSKRESASELTLSS